MFWLIQVLLILSVPALLGAGLIYLGFRRARKETARLKNPTKWDYINQAAGYWIVGGLAICFSIYRLLSALFG